MNENTHELGAMLASFFHERLAGLQHASKHTIKSYRDALKFLILFLCEKTGRKADGLKLEDLTAETVVAFLEHVELERGCSVRTRNQRLAAIKAFAGHVIFRRPEQLGQLQRILQIPSKRHVRRLVGFLVREEMDALLGAPDCTTALGRRHAMLILFLYNTGARVSEATQLSIEGLHLQTPAQVRLLGKGAKERVVPLWKDTAAKLEAMLAERKAGTQPDAPVFVNRRGQRLSREGVAHILRRAQQAAAKTCPAIANKKITPHVLRHTTAMHLLQSGVDLYLISTWLGHASLDPTHDYVEADLEMKRKALEQGGLINPPGEAPGWRPTGDILSFLESL